MKCFLLLLVLGLVTSEKLDYTYLPPPGAKYSGGTLDNLHPPLEFPKKTFTEAVQRTLLDSSYPRTFSGIPIKQDFEKGTFTDSNSVSSLPNNIKPTTQFLDYGDQSIVPTTRPVTNFIGSIPENIPSSGYLPSKQSTVGDQAYDPYHQVSLFEDISTTSTYRSDVSPINTNNLYVPVEQFNRNNIVNLRSNGNGYSSVGMSQLPNQINNGGVQGNGQNLIPQTIIHNDIADNYQPTSFGYYGGTPMIMNSQFVLPQDFRSMGLTSFSSEKSNLPLLNQNKIKNLDKPLPQPFQTSLVNQNRQNSNYEPTRGRTSGYNGISSQFPTTTNISLTKNTQTMLEQRNGNTVRTKARNERPQTEAERNAIIINYENSISPEGYSYKYDTSNGIHANEFGRTSNGARAQGSYSYTGDDGKIYSVTYTADENGFQPKGDHLPTPPPIPEAIQKVIEQATINKAAGIFDDGLYDEKKYGHMNYQGIVDNYKTFKKNNVKVSRLNGTKKKPSELLQNKNGTKHININQNNAILLTNDKTIESLMNTKNEEEKFNSTYAQGNYVNNEIKLSTGTRSNFAKNQNKGSLNNQIRKPITNLNNNQINIGKKSKNTNDVDDFSIKTQDQRSEKQTPGNISGDIYINEGYYYVPPMVKFNPNSKKVTDENYLYLTTGKSIPSTLYINTESNKRTQFDESQRKNDIEIVSSSPFSLSTVSTEPTRKPYISGPDVEEKETYDNIQSNVSSVNYIVKPDLNTNNLDSSLYYINTTPMTKQPVQASPPGGYSQYYQSSTNPTLFDQTIPTVESRISPEKSGISVSQDFITTTYRPSVSGDGVLEVNQNVKIYGIGRPQTTANFNGYPRTNPDNNSFHPVTSSFEQTVFGEYPTILTGPAQNTAVFQEISNQSGPYGAEYVTEAIPGEGPVISEGQYYDRSFDRLPESASGIEPNASIFNSNASENSQTITEKIETTSAISNQNLEPVEQYIGEDFSGPKQPQQFDTETGYYYK